MDSMIVRRDEVAGYTTNPTDVLRFLLRGDGEMPDITDETLMPGDGPPLHRHPWMTWEVVVQGRLLVRMGDSDVEVGDGDMYFTAPNVPHSFMVIGDGPARVIGVNWPGGFHHLYAEFSAAFASGAPDFGVMAAAAQRHGAEILGPPLAVLLAGAD